MKKLILFLLCCLLLTGCGSTAPAETQPEASVRPETLPQETTLPPEATLLPDLPLWGEVKDMTFCYSSGAGAWRYILNVDGQGGFSGYYVDSDLGETGPDYPNGTRYESHFTGRFSEPQPDGPGSYLFHVEALQDLCPLGSQIQEGVMVHTVHADQLESEAFLLYLPGKATSEMLPGTRDMLPMQDRDRNRLPYYVILNLDTQAVFVSDPAAPWVAGRNLLTLTKEEADFLGSGADLEALSQTDLNEIAQSVYECWDLALNDLWTMLQESLDEAAMADLLTSQRQWIQDKEAAAKASAAEAQGGSMAPLYYCETAAQWTQERAELLADLLPRS